MSFQCLARCPNVTPQTRQDQQHPTQTNHGEGGGKRRGNRRRGQLKGVKRHAQAGETGPQTTKHARAGEKGKTGTTKVDDEASSNRGDRATDEDERARRGEGAAPEDGEGGSGDVPGYVLTPEDLRLREVYGDWVHEKPGTHLDGGVANDSAWQAWWRDLAVMPSRRYDAPSGKVGRWFAGMLGAELQGVWDRRWKSERFIVFQTVILQQARHVTASHAIRRRIEKRLEAWGSGKHGMLFGDTLR